MYLHLNVWVRSLLDFNPYCDNTVLALHRALSFTACFYAAAQENGSLLRSFYKSGLLYFTLQIVFPHGAEVKVTMGQWFAPTFINIYMTPAAADFGKTEGLCGNYNSDVADDYKHKDGDITQVPADGVFFPRDFSKSWR